MMRKTTQKIIHSFWKGNLSQREAQNLLDSLEEQRLLMQAQFEKELQTDSPQLLAPQQSDKLFRRILRKAGLTDKPVKKIYPYKWMAAAAVLVVLSITGLLYQLQDASQAEQRDLLTIKNNLAEYNLVATQDSVTYVMSDGSRIMLSPHSSIRYDSGYGTANRTLKLVGEGVFVVKRDSLLPFEVTANGFTTTALGTTFIVDSRERDRTSVHLLSGKVMICSTAEARMPIQDTYLAAGEMLHIDETLRAAIRNAAPSSTVSFIPDSPVEHIANDHSRKLINLRFDKDELAEVIQKIAAHFDTAIVLHPEVADRLTFTGVFSPGDDLATILQTICLVNDLEEDRGHNGEIIIRLKASARSQATDTLEMKTFNK